MKLYYKIFTFDPISSRQDKSLPVAGSSREYPSTFFHFPDLVIFSHDGVNHIVCSRENYLDTRYSGPGTAGNLFGKGYTKNSNARKALYQFLIKANRI